MTARHDFWNTALATMAFLEYLEGEDRPSRKFVAVPAVREALDRVFPHGTPAVVAAKASNPPAASTSASASEASANGN